MKRNVLRGRGEIKTNFGDYKLLVSGNFSEKAVADICLCTKHTYIGCIERGFQG